MRVPDGGVHKKILRPDSRSQPQNADLVLFRPPTDANRIAGQHSLSGFAQREAIMIRPALITSLLVLSLVAPVNHASAQVGDASTRAPNHKVASPTKIAFIPNMKIDEACWRSEQRLFCTAEKVQYVQCGCPSSMINHCTTDNDNPAHPACSGYCLDSEENKHPCEQNTLSGPPKDPP